MPSPPLPGAYQCEQPDHNRHLQEFHQFYTSSRIPANNPAASQNQSFVPFELIQEYFRADNSIRLQDVLEAVFSEYEFPPVDLTVVQESYLKVFSILLAIGKARFINVFVAHDDLSDTRLPFNHLSKPPNFPDSTTQPSLWTLFSEAQWTFCAAEMKYMVNHQFEPDRILPIVSREALAEGGSAVVSKIELHPAFNKLQREGAGLPFSTAEHKDTFVLKTYHEAEAESYFYNEVEAFRRLGRGMSDTNLISFYGSYKHKGTYNVILEFADKGTLEEFFANVLPPSCGADIERFWNSICQVFKALVCIHEVEPYSSNAGPQIFQGWHQDVKPKNILVMSNHQRSPFDWKFKLADLGLTHFRRTSVENSGLDPTGTQTYGAPECYRADLFLEERALSVKQCIDLWSFGCILCEAAVWLVYGISGLKDFRQQRSREISSLPNTKKDGDWFHDGDKVLQTVLDYLENLKRDRRRPDDITQPIVDTLIKRMLDVPELRPTARGLYVLSNRVLDRRSSLIGSDSLNKNDATAGLQSVRASHSNGFSQDKPRPSTSSPSLGIPTSATPLVSPAIDQAPPQHPVSLPDRTEQRPENGNNPNPNLVIQGGAPPHSLLGPPNNAGLISSRGGSDAQLPFSEDRSIRPVPSDRPPADTGKVKSTSIELPNLPVDVAEKWIKDKREGRTDGEIRNLPGGYLLERLDNRDHVFLVDDAISMRTHMAGLKRVLSILAYLVKNFDPNGVDLYFTNSKRHIKSKNSSGLVEACETNIPNGLTDIRLRLGWLLDSYTAKLEKKSSRRTWPLFRTVRSLNIYVLTDGIWQPESDVTPQLKRLISKLKENGQYQVGVQFISFGSNELALKRMDYLDRNPNLEMDIIDHERSTGNVWKMFFGATDPWFDSDKTKPQGIGSSSANSPQR